MKAAQRHAVALFTAHGFEAVTVEQVAATATVSPVSVYRWFGSKEGLVLWDEYDPGLFAAVAEHLTQLPPLEAVRAALVDELGRIYDADRELVLARTQLIYREPALLAATSHDMRALQQALAGLFEEAGGDAAEGGAPAAADRSFACYVLAGVAVGAMVAAIEDWQRQEGEVPLADLMHAAFDVIREAPWTT